MIQLLSNGICSPLFAVMTSTGADLASEKNNLTFADMLAPFCSSQISIKDPMGNQTNTKLFLDIRDVKRSGFLLSHTVLPHVLKENVLTFSHFIQQLTDVFSSTFADSFLYWFEPAEHDFLRSYICCIFVVSVNDTDPLEELNCLQHLQNLQQHGGDKSSTSLSLAHCSSPKWMLPNILKYYVLIQDASSTDDKQAQTIFDKITKKYGVSFCHLLKINSTTCSRLPNPWMKIIEQRYRGLQAGLLKARQAILETSNTTISNENKNSNLYISVNQLNLKNTSFSLLSNSNLPQKTTQQSQNSLFLTSNNMPSVINQNNFLQNTSQPMSYANVVNGYNESETNSINTIIKEKQNFVENLQSVENLMKSNSVEYGSCLDSSDRERLKNFIDDFVQKALIPFVEHQLILQNETLNNRRTIGRSLTNMRKWLSAASLSMPVSSTLNVSYGNESSELQTRCLADLAFQFGLYNFAHQLYQSLKKDFANDQAWLHHAGALEMAALSSFLGYISTHFMSENVPSFPGTIPNSVILQLQKTYPQRYMNNAINYYLNVCLQPMLALRCVILSSTILTSIKLYSEAANQLILLNTNTIPDLFVGILLERAAKLYEMDKKCKRMTLYLMLAAQRYAKANLLQFSLINYQNVLPLLSNKGWAFAEGYICYTLVKQHELLIANVAQENFEEKKKFFDLIINCFKCLLQSQNKQPPEQQFIFLIDYIKLLKKYENVFAPIKLEIPKIVMSQIRIFYGDISENSRLLRSVSYSIFNNCSDTKIVTFNSTLPEEFRSNEGFDGILLKIGHPLTIWNELEKTALEYYNLNDVKNNEKAHLYPLFSDELTDNSNPISVNFSPINEPITVQLVLNNTLGIPLVLRNLRLGVYIPELQQSNNKSIESYVNIENLDCVKLGPINYSNITNNSQTNQIIQESDVYSNNTVQINLSITPLCSIKLLEIVRLDYEICIDSELNLDTIFNNQNEYIDNTLFQQFKNLNLKISGFIPLKIPGKRLFKTKEQKQKPTYLLDNRLQVSISNFAWPFLDFKMTGNTRNRATSHQINAYCNQMYQIIIEIENCGQIPVYQFYGCTDQPELVSLSEENENFNKLSNVPNDFNQSITRWEICDSTWVSSSSATSATSNPKGILLHKLKKVNLQRPFNGGQKMLLRLAFRTPNEEIKNFHISMLFFYVGKNSITRQFRYNLILNTQKLLSCNLQLLNPNDGLSVLHLENLISTKDSFLAKIELQRFSTIVLALEDQDLFKNNKSKNAKQQLLVKNISNLHAKEERVNIEIKPVLNKKVVLESEQTQNYCFYLRGFCDNQQNFNSQFLSELWISDFVSEIPEWSHLISTNEFVPHLSEGIESTLNGLDFLQLNNKKQKNTSQIFYENNTAVLLKKRILHLRFAVLWKAYITNSDGTVTTVFGENLLLNPFVSNQLIKSHFFTIPGLSEVFTVTNSELKQIEKEKALKQQQNLKLNSLTSNLNLNFQKLSIDLPNPFTALLNQNNTNFHDKFNVEYVER